MISIQRLCSVAVVAASVFVAGCSSNGSGTIHPVPVTIQWATPAAVTVGTTLSSTQLDATAVAPGGSTPLLGVFTYSPAAGTVLNTVGPVTLSVTFYPTQNDLYATTTGTVTLAVNPPQTPTIQWPTPASVVGGTALSSTQLDATAYAPGSTTPLPGTYVYTPAAGTVLNTVGANTLSVTFTPTDNFDYTTATATTTINVTVPSTPTYSWSNVKIVGGGFVTGIVMHPAQQGLMYARTDVGGAYRWDATNSVWVPLTDWVTRANSNLIGIESIGIDPSDPTKLYLAAGTYADYFGQDGAMLLSSDQGATFTVVDLPIKLGSNDNGRNAGERLQVDPNLGSTIYFGSRNNGLWRSTNSGQSWSQVNSFPVTAPTSGVGVVFEDFIPSTGSAGSATQTIYAGVSATGTGSDPKSLYVSNDGGNTWAAVPGAPTGLYVTHGVLGPDGNLYFTYGDQVGPGGLTTGTIYQYVLPTSSNPNGTWNNITPPRTVGYQGGYGAVTLDQEKPGVIMVSTLDHYYPVGDDLWRSTNYGQTWYSINTVGADRDASLSPWLYEGQTTIVNTGNWVAALQIDPFDSDHVVHGTGGTIWTTSDMTTSDSGNTSHWTVGANGVEETVLEDLISPPAGPANLLSAMGDLGDFQHTDLTVSPAAGALSNPRFTTSSSIDFAQLAPQNMVRVGTGSGNSQLGGYSTDYGTDWTPFATNPASVVNGLGSIAIGADGSSIVWSAGDSGSPTSYSNDSGTTWTASTGAPANQTVVADRVTADTFYIYDSNTGKLYTSTDGGASFTLTQSGLPTGGSLVSSYDTAGNLWLATSGGLYHSVSGTLTLVSGVGSAWGIAFGAPDPYATNTTALTLYLGGTVNGQAGIYRSTNSGNSWVRIDDAAHEYGYINCIQADQRVFGRVYLGTGGRGIVQGNSAF